MEPGDLVLGRWMIDFEDLDLGASNSDPLTPADWTLDPARRHPSERPQRAPVSCVSCV